MRKRETDNYRKLVKEGEGWRWNKEKRRVNK